MRVFLLGEKENGHDNHFCLIKQVTRDGYDNIWMHWRERHLVFRLESFPGEGPSAQARQIRMSRPLDLAKDVVDSEREVEGSTYLVTRYWVRSVLEHCAAEGVKLIVPAFVGPTTGQ